MWALEATPVPHPGRPRCGMVPDTVSGTGRFRTMDILRHVLLFIHVLGFAALLGGLLVQVREPEKKANSLMRDGSGTAFVAGLALVGVLEAGDADVNHAKIGAKLVLALVILVLVMANLRKPRISNGLYWTIFVLTLVTIGTVIFWSSPHTF